MPDHVTQPEEQGKKRRGRPPKPVAALQRNRVDVWLTDNEKAWLDAARLRAAKQGRSGLSPGEFLRRAALGRVLPRPVPAVNHELYGRLSKNLGAWTTIARAAGQWQSEVLSRVPSSPPFAWTDEDRKAIRELRKIVEEVRYLLFHAGDHS